MRRWLGYLLIIIFFFAFVDGLLPQMQMALLSGGVIIKSIILKTLLGSCLLSGLFFYILKKRRIIWFQRIGVPYSLLVIYLIIHFMLLSGQYPLDYLLFTYNVNYSFLLLLPVAAYISLGDKAFNKWLIAVSIPIVALGLFQHIFNDPILPVASTDDYFKVLSWNYYDGKVRSFSFFSSGLGYGHFLSLLGGISAFYILNRRGWHRCLMIFLLLVISFAMYATLTRNIYIEFFFTILSVYLLVMGAGADSVRAKIMRKVMPWLPIGYGVAAALAVFATQLYLVFRGEASLIIRDESLNQRLLEWAYYFPLWTQNGLTQLLLGTGLVEATRFSISEEVTVDNSFLAIGVHSGLIGLVLWTFLMWRIWKWLLAMAMKTPESSIALSIAGMWSTWISSGIFNSMISLYPMLAIVAVSSYFTKIKSGHASSSDRVMSPPVVASGNSA